MQMPSQQQTTCYALYNNIPQYGDTKYICYICMIIILPKYIYLHEQCLIEPVSMESNTYS